MPRKKAAEDKGAFARRLTELRTARNMTQRDLSTAAGLGPQLVGKYEAGQNLPTWNALCALADALGVSLEEFRTSADQRDNDSVTLARVKQWFEQSPLGQEK